MADTKTTEAVPQLFTVAQFAERHPAWSQASLRNLILNAADRFNSRGERIPGNGLSTAGGIVRLGRRVLVSERSFFAWVAQMNRKAAA